jgi:hypothetical protein
MKFLYYLLVALLPLCVLSQSKKLVIYPVVTPNTVQPAGADYSSLDICLKLQIDTIDTKDIEWIKPAGETEKYGLMRGFAYKGMRCNAQQLFELNQYDDLLKAKIVKFRFLWLNDKSVYIINSHCFSPEIKKIVRKKYKRMQKKGSVFYIDEITIKTQSKEILLYNKLALNIK